ncbi:hypothetical protein [Novipirellula rosea]|uniref:Uncharacterized protein n=1 Tax=Novipirellula rosea TaxID=1031540 RepID=A0ABP8NP65_9BACT
MNQDLFIEFKSRLGNSIVHPSQWRTEDNGDSFTLASPDDQAVITALTFTVEGTGAMTDFQSIIESQIDGDWADSPWNDFIIGDAIAMRRKLVPSDDSGDTEWLIYTTQRGDCYHALMLNASSLALALNGDFYENIVRSFVGISTVP